MWRRGGIGSGCGQNRGLCAPPPRLRRRSSRRQGTRRVPAPAPERRAARPASPRPQQSHPPRRQSLPRLMRQAVRRQSTRQAPASALEWPPARPPPLRPLGSHPPRRCPLLRLMRRSVRRQSTRQVPASAPKWPTRETGSAASASAPSDSAAGADCGAVAAAGAAVGAPPAGAPLDRAAGADRRGGAALASIAIGFRLPAAAVSPGDAGVSSPLRRAGAAGAAAARVRFGARREDSRGR